MRLAIKILLFRKIMTYFTVQAEEKRIGCVCWMHSLHVCVAAAGLKRVW